MKKTTPKTNHNAEIQRIFVRQSTTLHDATKKGIFGDIEKIIATNVFSVNDYDQFGQTPLHIACFEGYEDVVDLLIRKGASLSVQDKNGWTPLHCAATNQHLSICERLITEGADPNAQINIQNEHGMTPLHNACLRASEGLVLFLILNGADLETTTFHKERALHISCRLGKQRLVESLLIAGSNPNVEGPDGNAEETARRNGHDSLSEFIHSMRTSALHTSGSYGFVPGSHQKKKKKKGETDKTSSKKNSAPGTSSSKKIKRDASVSSMMGSSHAGSSSDSMSLPPVDAGFNINASTPNLPTMVTSSSNPSISINRNNDSANNKNRNNNSIHNHSSPSATTDEIDIILPSGSPPSSSKSKKRHSIQKGPSSNSASIPQTNFIVMPTMEIPHGTFVDDDELAASSMTPKASNPHKFPRSHRKERSSSNPSSHEDRNTNHQDDQASLSPHHHHKTHKHQTPQDGSPRSFNEAGILTRPGRSHSTQSEHSPPQDKPAPMVKAGSQIETRAKAFENRGSDDSNRESSPASKLVVGERSANFNALFKIFQPQEEQYGATSARSSSTGRVAKSNTRTPSPDDRFLQEHAQAEAATNRTNRTSPVPNLRLQKHQNQQRHSSPSSQLYLQQQPSSASSGNGTANAENGISGGKSPHKASSQPTSSPLQESSPSKSFKERLLRDQQRDSNRDAYSGEESSRTDGDEADEDDNSTSTDINASVSSATDDTASDSKVASGRVHVVEMTPRSPTGSPSTHISLLHQKDTNNNGSPRSMLRDRSSSDVVVKTKTSNRHRVDPSGSSHQPKQKSQPLITGMLRTNIPSTEFGPRLIQRINKTSKSRQPKPFCKSIKDVSFETIVAPADFPSPPHNVVNVSESMIIQSPDYMIEVGRVGGNTSPKMFTEDLEPTQYLYKDNFFDEKLVSYSHWNLVGYIEVKTMSMPVPIIISLIQRNGPLLGVIRSLSGDTSFFMDTSGKKSSSLNAKKVVKLLQEQNADLSSAKFTAVKDPSLVDELLHYEKAEKNQFKKTFSHKVGILYVKEGQITEEEILGNKHGSESFEKFLNCIGQKVELHDWRGFDGGLDTRKDRSGKYSIFSTWQDFEIMFHVSTYLPLLTGEEKYVERKKHIANDMTTIVFLDTKSTAFKPPTISGDFLHNFIIVNPREVSNGADDEEDDDDGNRTRNNNDDRDFIYFVSVATRKGIPEFGPSIPPGGLFELGAELKEFILSKVINAERATLLAPMFLSKRRQARHQLLSLMINKFTPTK